jgi:hypothetical protein
MAMKRDPEITEVSSFNDCDYEVEELLSTISAKTKGYVYGWYDFVTGKRYIGFRKSADVDDGYIFSSKNPELQRAWSLGHLRRTILYFGSARIAIILERYLLKSADARRNDMWYNSSNGGGGDGGILDMSIITVEHSKVGLDWIDGIEPAPKPVDVFALANTKLAKKILKLVKNGYYTTIEEPITVIAEFGHNQVRAELYDPAHVDDIATQMRSDPAEARKHVQPIVVVVYPDGTKLIVDGNHTSRAAFDAGWISAPVIYINSSDFDDDDCTIDYYGNLANHKPFKKKGNTPADCQRAIIQSYAKKLKDLDDDKFTLLQSDKFKLSVTHQFDPVWTRSVISSNLKKAIERIKTDQAIAEMNYQLYSKTDLTHIQKEIDLKYPNHASITVTSGAIYNAGVGGVLNKMGQADIWDGVIITHHAGLTDYENWDTYFKKLTSSVKRMNPRCNLKIILLDSFTKNMMTEIDMEIPAYEESNTIAPIYDDGKITHYYDKKTDSYHDEETGEWIAAEDYV